MDYGSHTSDLIQRRKDLKQKADATDAYRSLSKEVQKLCRKDKEKYIANICKEIEEKIMETQMSLETYLTK